MFIGLLILLCAVAVISFLLTERAEAPKAQSLRGTVGSAPAASSKAPVTPAPPFDASRYSTTDSASLWVVVNKQHPLSPIDYAPSDLVTAYGHQVGSRLVPDLTAMITDAAKTGAAITLVSTYRSYPYQVSLYNSYVSADGQEKADTYSARPGYSEHQTGLAVDFGDRAGTCVIETCYGDTAEGKWLAANAYKYGFLLRYTAAERTVTGYQAEAWHYRYIGRDLASEMHKRGIATLEEFFSVTGGEAYN